MRHSFIAKSIPLLVIGLIWTVSAHAVPSFARKYSMNCSGCHNAYPQLNSIGRGFKEAGYRFPTDNEKGVNDQISDFLQLEKHVPISGVLVSRPYENSDSGNDKVQAIAEVEIIMAGNIAKQWSGYFELEGENEENFEPEIGPAVLSYNRSEAVNVQVGWSPIFWADPYGILGNHFRLTSGSVGAIDQSFGGADADSSLIALRQNVGVFGRVAKRVFYNLNWSGDAADAEGTNANTLSALVDYEFTNNIMLGVFGVSGENEDTDTGEKRDYTRSGVQFQSDISDGRIQALYIAANDDLAGGTGDEDNDAFSIQGYWTFTDDSLRPTWVPLVRYDAYETNDGQDSFSELTLNLGYYFTQNIKGFVEYWDRFDAPTSEEEDDRILIQIVAAF